MNNVNLIGRLTRDVEIRQTKSGQAVCNFCVAVQRNYKNLQGEYGADFINCTAWKQPAEFMKKYFFKGDQIGISGRLQVEKWENEGKTQHVAEVIVEQITFVGERKPKSKNIENEVENVAALSDFEAAINNINLPF